MRTALFLVALLALAACSATPIGGVATYDELKKAQEACQAKGGALTLKPMGDSQYLEDYACKRN